MSAAGEYPSGRRHGQVVHGLGEQIVRGELPPGAAVPTEDQLVEQFGVGRSAIREGVKVLAGKGLVESRTSAGTRVRSRDSWSLLDRDIMRWRFSPEPSAQDIAVMANLRVALEPGAARLAAESITPRSQQDIDVALAAMRATLDIPEEFIEADLAFHRAIFLASQNDLLLYIHDSISVAMESIRPLHTSSVERNTETMASHEAVGLAIRRGHHRKAETAMRTVVEEARHDALNVSDFRVDIAD